MKKLFALLLLVSFTLASVASKAQICKSKTSYELVKKVIDDVAIIDCYFSFNPAITIDFYPVKIFAFNAGFSITTIPRCNSPTVNKRQ